MFTKEHTNGVGRYHIPQGIVRCGVEGRSLSGGEGVDHAGAERDDGDGSDLVLETDQTPEYFSKVTEPKNVELDHKTTKTTSPDQRCHEADVD